MAIEEAFTLDGLALNDGTTFGIDGEKGVDMTPPGDRPNWIGAADSETQLLTRTPLHENRVITIPLVVIQQSTMDLVHDKIALVLDKLQKASKYTDGIALTWTPRRGRGPSRSTCSSRPITDLPVDWENGWIGRRPRVHDRVDVQAVLARHGSPDLDGLELDAVRDARGRVVTGDVPRSAG
jgi:hypothetical protein